ncbi:arylmalonate decarboxylase [Streptomonospora sp. PA3]|uniref:maleate cis-trans isomerase family protein n=1 Tax=Streptomonospora sp. PA3 TaxID=2607326 RepID=UPI0012DC4999|nr:arylmalonate decarboxylase [Streptomonospora sp. PA3]MUL41064.1 arylmalonate decarboxylase [Streptomonospora sp. PA3]
MDRLSMPRIGLVVPPENPTVEPELNQLIGSAVNLYATRFPLLPGKELKEMLATYNEVLGDTLANFGAMGLDAAVVACSASHYLLSPDGDREYCERLTRLTGFPVQSSTQAILAACDAMGLRRLTLVPPYEPWLTRISRRFWEESGIAVEGVVPVPVGDTFDPYRVTTGMILEKLRRHEVPAGSALLFTGTGMSTLTALEVLAQDSGRVLLSSNLASAWWALRETGASEGRRADHPLLRRLRARPVPSDGPLT